MSDSEELGILVNEHTREYIVRELNEGVDIPHDSYNRLVYILSQDKPSKLIAIEEFNERDFTWLFTRIPTYLKWVEKLWGHIPSRRLGDVK